MAYPAGARNTSTNSSLPKGKIKPGSYVKPGGKATGNMKDYALNTQARRDEYTARGWKQDKTTEIKSSTPAASQPSTLGKGSANPYGSNHMRPKSKAEIEAYSKSLGDGKTTEYQAMQNNRGSKPRIDSNIKGSTSKVDDVKMQDVNAAENRIANNNAVGKNTNIAKLTNNPPKISAGDIDKTIDTKSSGGVVSKSAMRSDGAHSLAQARGINPTAGAKSKLDGLVTGLDKTSSYANLDSSPGKTAVSQIRKEAASAPKQTTLAPGGGSGMGQAHAMNMSMASTVNKATDKKGLFAGLKERRAANKATTPDPSQTTLKQKDSAGPITSSSKAGPVDVMKLYEDERSKYL